MSAHRDPLDVVRLIVQSDDWQDRLALYLEFLPLYEAQMRAERRVMHDAVKSVRKVLGEHRAAVARIHSKGSPKPRSAHAEADRDAAVAAVRRMMAANPAMSVNSAARKVSASTGIPVRTLATWVSGK
jgi:hypothetical protein